MEGPESSIETTSATQPQSVGLAPGRTRTRTAPRMRRASSERSAGLEPLPSFDATVLGARIAALRQRHGWTQRRLAEEAGVSNGYVAQLELGRLPNPGKARLDAIAHALLLRTSDALLSEDEDEAARADEEFEGDEVEGVVERVRRAPEPARIGPSGALRPSGASTASAVVAPSGVGGVEVVNGGSGDDGGSFVPGGNVVGMLEQVRGLGTRQLPVFRWGSCGDPRDRLSPPDPDRLEYPPPGRESLIGDNGFGVVVKGESMAGRGIHDGDVVWVNPERPYALGKVVLALATSDEGGEAGMVVKTYARTEVGECLVSETESGGRSPVVCHEFRVIGPVVGITSWRLPS